MYYQARQSRCFSCLCSPALRAHALYRGGPRPEGESSSKASVSGQSLSNLQTTALPSFLASPMCI